MQPFSLLYTFLHSSLRLLAFSSNGHPRQGCPNQTHIIGWRFRH
uniref:Uncharacterized protein n=1 Tax=Rhizophora mucronata TaxID=61149 RepID=A0A2P2QR11_RHIMU